MINLQLIALFMISVCTLSYASASQFVKPPCEIVNKEYIADNVAKLDIFNSSNVLVCTNNGNKKYYDLSNIKLSSLGNCHYEASFVIQTTNNITNRDTINFYSKQIKSECPEYGDGSYVILNKRELGEKIEEHFNSIVNIVDSLKGDAEKIDTIFSSLSWFDRLFCGNCRELKNSLIKIKDKNKIRVVDFFEYDSSASPKLYLLSIEVGSKPWNLGVIYQKEKLVVRDISKAIR